MPKRYQWLGKVKMPKKRLVILRYEFEWDPNELWSRKSEFDQFIGKAFGAINVDSEFIDFIGVANEARIRLTMKETPPKPKSKQKPKKPVNVSGKGK